VLAKTSLASSPLEAKRLLRWKGEVLLFTFAPARTANELMHVVVCACLIVLKDNLC